MSTLCESLRCWREASVSSSSSFLLCHLKYIKTKHYQPNTWFVMKQKAIVSHMSDLGRPQVVEKKLGHCPAPEVLSQKPDWKSFGNWALGHGLSCHFPHHCLQQGEPRAYLFKARSNTNFYKASWDHYSTSLNRFVRKGKTQPWVLLPTHV